MIEKICLSLTNKIRKEMPEIDDERAEIINFGLQNIIGEIPKIFPLIIIGYLLGVGNLTILTFLIVLPYRVFSGGFHLKSHFGCIFGTSLFYCGIAFASKYIVLVPLYKYILIALVFVFGIIMITLYAPADTENIPILSLKERKQKKILSYIFLTIELLIACFISNNIISNIIIFGMLAQSISITKFMYKLTKNKYGYEVYNPDGSLKAS